eukprot:971288_1
MAQDSNYVYNSDSEGPITTDEEQEEIVHQIEMKQLEQSMRLVTLHRDQKKKRKQRKIHKSMIHSLKQQSQHMLLNIFRNPALCKIVSFNNDETFTFSGHTFSAHIIQPYISITWNESNNAYVFVVQIPRSMHKVMRWATRFKPTYHTYRQKDSEYYYKDLKLDLIDHIEIMKFDYIKQILAMLQNTIDTPFGPFKYFKYEKDIKDKQINSIIDDLQEDMIRKIQLRTMG